MKAAGPDGPATAASVTGSAAARAAQRADPIAGPGGSPDEGRGCGQPDFSVVGSIILPMAVTLVAGNPLISACR